MTNTVVLESGVFKNADGLRVKYGLAEARKGVAGTVASKDDERYLYVDLDWSRMPLHSTDGTGNIYGSEPESSIPTGAIVTGAQLEVTTPFAGTGAQITIGLVDRNGVDKSLNNCFFDDLAITDLDTIGEIMTKDYSDQAQDLSTAATPLYIWVEVDTADLTAGAARLKITYNMPRSV